MGGGAGAATAEDDRDDVEDDEGEEHDEGIRDIPGVVLPVGATATSILSGAVLASLPAHQDSGSGVTTAAADSAAISSAETGYAAAAAAGVRPPRPSNWGSGGKLR